MFAENVLLRNPPEGGGGGDPVAGQKEGVLLEPTRGPLNGKEDGPKWPEGEAVPQSENPNLGGSGERGVFKRTSWQTVHAKRSPPGGSWLRKIYNSRRNTGKWVFSSFEETAGSCHVWGAHQFNGENPKSFPKRP